MWKMQPHPLSAMSRFIICVTMIFICGSKLVFAQEDERYVSCSNSFDCGIIKNIGYPFWGSNRPDYCGYPGLELDCSNQDPEITFMQLTYKVLGINNSARTLIVARTDYAENICPTQLFNTTLNPNLLNYTQDDHNMTIYYDCPAQDPPIPGILTPFTCNIDSTNTTGYFAATTNFSFLGSSAPTLISYLVSCKNSVIVPLRQSALQSIISNATVPKLVGALNQGFGLEWNAKDNLCVTCKDSGGQCGYNQNTAAFACYCADQPQEFSCQGSPPTNDQPTPIHHKEPLNMGKERSPSKHECKLTLHQEMEKERKAQEGV
ncbi:unnamed protein product [Dovyalis caffra]|uniref:non-specific serine/threonine protein kinase n=1 Tax=Dovyalis caffra TaxID=77055 RepID=A0AAV1S2J2_9ROSI|nr:unnamed protein product [Dovyalis caffra]